MISSIFGPKFIKLLDLPNVILNAGVTPSDLFDFLTLVIFVFRQKFDKNTGLSPCDYFNFLPKIDQTA